MFTDPSATARSIWIDDRRLKISIPILRRALVVSGELERAHDAGRSVSPCKMESRCHCVESAVLVAQGAAALDVVIIDEG